MRLRRRIAAIPLLKLGWAGAAVPAGLLVVVVLAIGAALALRTDDPPRGSPDVTRTEGPLDAGFAVNQTRIATSSAVTASPVPVGATSEPVPSVTNSRFGPGNGQDVLATIDGEPIFELEVSSTPTTLPKDSILYYSYCPVMCQGASLVRASVDPNGGLTQTQLGPRESEFGPGSTFGAVVTDGGSRFAVLWCEEAFGRCGKTHDANVIDDVPRSVLVSNDGGITWERVGAHVGPDTAVVGFVHGEAVLSKRSTGDAVEYVSAATGATVSPPAAPRFVGADGSTISIEQAEVAEFISWTVVTVQQVAPAETTALAFPLGYVSLDVALSDGRFLGYGHRSEKATDPRTSESYGELRPSMVLVDLEQRSVSYVAGMQSADLMIDGRTPLAFYAGPFVQVATEPCLNVREQATTESPALDCFAPGVVLQVRTETGPDGWTAVTTLDGRAGWVASEYVRPLE